MHTKIKSKWIFLRYTIMYARVLHYRSNFRGQNLFAGRLYARKLNARNFPFLQLQHNLSWKLLGSLSQTRTLWNHCIPNIFVNVLATNTNVYSKLLQLRQSRTRRQSRPNIFARLIFACLIFAITRDRENFFTLSIYSGKIFAREKYSNYGIRKLNPNVNLKYEILSCLKFPSLRYIIKSMCKVFSKWAHLA